MSRRRATYNPCPNAHKTPFGTQQLADEAIRRIRLEDSPHRTQLPIRSYHCRCGSWHMTHQEKRATEAVPP